AFCVHLFSVRKTTLGTIWMEPRSDLGRICDCGRYARTCFSPARTPHRSIWTAADQLAMHDSIRISDSVTGDTALRVVAVLCAVLRAGGRREWCCAPRVLALNLDLVRPEAGDRTCFRHGGSRPWGDDLAGGRAGRNYVDGLASGLCCAGWYRISAWAATELALHPRAWRQRTKVRSRRACGRVVATGFIATPVLDCDRHSFREFDQHERGNHASFSIADRPRFIHRKGGTVRVHSGRI